MPNLWGCLVPAVALALSLPAATAAAEEWFDAYNRSLDALRLKQGARAVEALKRAYVGLSQQVKPAPDSDRRH